MTRRQFLTVSAGIMGGLTMQGFGLNKEWTKAFAETIGDEPFGLSLAQWSLHRTIEAGKMDNLDFAKVSKRDFGIDTIEFVDQFFADKSKDQAYLNELKKRADDEGVRIGLIMIDTNGPLAAADKAARAEAVEKTYAWIDAAAFLGCHSIRINAWGEGDADAKKAAMIESCGPLVEYAKGPGLNVIIENHGECSSDPHWLLDVVHAINQPHFGLLPDFGNFPDEIDRYDAVEKMMPYAKAVSAKAISFTPDGQVAETDYRRMMRIVRDGGYNKWVGVESEGETIDEAEAIRKTRDLLLVIREEEKKRKPIFNGVDLSGWTAIEGGDWIIENGVLIGRNGRNWSTNPEKTGSWLHTDQEYGDFRLELQYSINTNGNSGVFFRSALEKNPAFTGYEMQIYDAPGQPPTKQGPSAIYDVLAPSANRVRPAGEWNTVTITARGTHIQVEMNGATVIDAELPRSSRGYIGLQNHDEKSEVRYRNIRLEQL